jgi:hypothetical protein
MICFLSENGHQAGTNALVPMPPNAPMPSISSVRAPSRAAAAAAVHPDGPPPATITSQESSKGNERADKEKELMKSACGLFSGGQPGGLAVLSQKV